MKADATFLEQIRAEAGPGSAEAMKRMGAAVMSAFHQEHESDNRHKIIHATGAIFERGRTVTALGDPYSIPFTPGDFTGFGTMTWTVGATDITTWAYALSGSTMTLWFDLRATTIGGVATAAVQIKIPSGWYAALTVSNACQLLDNAVAATGYIQSTINTNQLLVFRTDLAVWTASANNTRVHGQISFPVRTA
jgi:hypothetical protein